MSDIKSSLLVALTSRYLVSGVQIASFVVLARLLTPSDIGIFSVCTAVLGIAAVVRDFGLSSYLIQEVELTVDRISTASAMTLLLGAFLSVSVFLASAPLASFYNDDRLTPMLQVGAVTFLIVPLGAIQLALMKRRMLFQRLMAISVSSTIIGQLVAVVGAFFGYGYWALLFANIATTATTACLALILGRGQHKGGSWSLREIKHVSRFGGLSTIAKSTGEISNGAQDMLLGKFLDFHLLGLYSRALGVISLFARDVAGTVVSVMYPAFARAHRTGQNTEELFWNSTSSLVGFSVPFFALVAIFPDTILNLLFGSQWIEASTVLPILAIGGVFSVGGCLVVPLLTATGQVGRVLRLEALVQSLRIAILLLALTVTADLYHVAVAYAFTQALACGLSFAAKAQSTLTNWPLLLDKSARTAAVGLCCVLIPLFIRHLSFTDLGDGYVRLTTASFLTVLAWIGTIHLVRHDLSRHLVVKKMERSSLP